VKRTDLLVFAVLVGVSTSAAAQDPCAGCAEPLQRLYPNVIKWDVSKSLSSNVWDYFCSSGFETKYKNTSGNASVTVPIEGVPLKFGGGGQQEESWGRREEACRAGSNRLSTDESAQVFIRLVPEAVQLNAQNVWLECRKTCRSTTTAMMTLDVKRFGTRAVFELRLHPDASIAYVHALVPQNLEDCTGTMKTLGDITSRGLNLACTITDTAALASLTVLPTLGAPVTAVVEAPTPAPTPTPRPVPPPVNLSMSLSSPMNLSTVCSFVRVGPRPPNTRAGAVFTAERDGYYGVEVTTRGPECPGCYTFVMRLDVSQDEPEGDGKCSIKGPTGMVTFVESKSLEATSKKNADWDFSKLLYMHAGDSLWLRACAGQYTGPGETGHFRPVAGSQVREVTIDIRGR
jgi:hypothetical protein